MWSLKNPRITTTEVNIARTHNYGVKMRQAAKAGFGWVNAGIDGWEDKTYMDVSENSGTP